MVDQVFQGEPPPEFFLREEIKCCHEIISYKEKENAYLKGKVDAYELMFKDYYKDETSE